MVARIYSTFFLILLCTVIVVFPVLKANDAISNTADSHKCCCDGMRDCCDKATVSNGNHPGSGHTDICCSYPSPNQNAAVPTRTGHTISPIPIEVISPFTLCETPTRQVYFSAQCLSYPFMLIPTHINLRAPPVCV